MSEQTAKQKLRELIERYERLSADERKAMSETSVVNQFISELLGDVLGWPIKDPARYVYEKVTEVGRPDMILTPEKGGTIFVEAKRFGKIEDFKEIQYAIAGTVTPGQLALPGMAVDRSKEEQQAINYAFKLGGTWAILTNFEKLRLFNARRDWLVLAFETPKAYLKDFEWLWELSYESIINGSLDRLSNQRLKAEVDTDYLKFINEWRERLAQDVIERREQNPWAFLPDGTVDLATLRAVVQRIIDRLVILRYAEDHLVLPAGTLHAVYDVGEASYLVDIDQMLNTMFRRFDKIHNSALFALGPADKASFSHPVIMKLVSKLYEARYRSMPPDIMGNTYEQYLGKTLVRSNGSVKTADNLETRKKQGSYYTPQVIVQYIVDNSLGRYLYATENGKPDGKPIPGETRKTSADLRDLRVLDSACGSGSFLIYAYQVLDQFYEGEKARIEIELDSMVKQLAQQNLLPHEIQIQVTPLQVEKYRITDHRKLILETHLYGVDLDPQAAEIAVVNLMMRGMERRDQEKRLPLILNQNVKVGNSLIGLRHDDPRLAEHAAEIAAIRKLRADLINTPHDTPEHDRIIEALKQQTDYLNGKLDASFAEYFADVSAVRMFHWGIEFPEVFFDGEGKPLENPGFTIIFGNPPWEILKPDLREFYAQFDPKIESELKRKEVESRIAELEAEDPRRRGAYEASVKVVEQTAAYARKSGDYTRQGRGDTATHKLFLERMYGLLRNEGRLGYVVPSGIYTDLGTKELREMLLDNGNIQYIFSFSNERFFFHGVDHRFKFTMIGVQKGPQHDGFWSVFRFNPRVAIKPDDLTAFLDTSANLVYVKRESLVRFSPDSLSVMEFQEPKDYEVVEKLYDHLPLLADKEAAWTVKLNNEFHFTNDRHLLNQNGRGLPFYEGKMIHQYNAFYGDPQFWIDDEKIKQQSDILQQQLRTYRVAHRRIARSTDERTLISAIVPCNSACEVNATVVLIEGNADEKIKPYVCALLNSFVLDYIIRYKVSTTLNMFYLYQLPMPRLVSGDPYFDAIVPRAARLTSTRPEFAELWQSVMGEPWDESKGATDPAERQRLRDEIDALVAHLYGLSREDFDHILGTFPLVFPDDQAGQAKRRALLDVFEGM